jgi:hypothetical protein
MRIIYNGVDMMPLETHAYDAEAVYDDSGTDYLYTRISIVVRAIINGQSEVVGGVSPNGPPISYQWSDESSLSAGTVPSRGYPMWPTLPTPIPDQFGRSVVANSPTTVPDSGLAARTKSTLRTIVRIPNAPLLTHQAIRHRLSTPRGKLWVFAGAGTELGNIDTPNQQAVVSLECPEAGLHCDCKNGPQPKILAINAAMGDATTMIADWSCEAYINEGPENSVNPTGALLSNRFAQTQMIDQAGYTTVITAGVAIFRTDKVYSLPQAPDSLRPVLFMPIVPGFVRENIVVNGRPDVTGIEYSYRDRQVPVNFPAGVQTRAASISAVHRQAITSGGDVIEGALSAYERILGIRAQRNFAKMDVDGEDGKGDAKAMRKLARMIGASVSKSMKGAPVVPPSAHPGGGI